VIWSVVVIGVVFFMIWQRVCSPIRLLARRVIEVMQYESQRQQASIITCIIE
jgi:hypothetical protein